MKKTSAILSLALLSLFASAQPRPLPPERMSDEEIIRMQTLNIVQWLDFDKKTESKFIKEYTAFRKEIDAVAKKARPPRDIKSEDEIDRAIQQNFAVSEKILKIRKKYYGIFKDFMKPSQIQRMYQIENEAGRRMHGEPGNPEGPEGRTMPGMPGGPAMPGRPDMPGGPAGPDRQHMM